MGLSLVFSTLRPFGFAVLLLVVPFSGCVELEELLAPSPDVQIAKPRTRSVDADPMVVPVVRDGERATFTTTVEGYHFPDHHDHEGRNHSASSEPTWYSRNWSTTRSVNLVRAQDAWLRTTPAVEFVHQEHAQRGRHHDGHGGWSSRSVYELATGLAMYTEFAYRAVSVDCDGDRCREVADDLASTSYPRQREDANFGSLNGRTLHVGDEIHFERVVELFDFSYQETIDYEVLRAEPLDGARAFVVSFEADWKPLGEHEDPQHVEPERAPADQEPVPEPQTLLWFTQRASVPLQQTDQRWFRHEGTLYNTTSTTRLSEYERGDEEISWGAGEALAPITAVSDGVRADAYFGANGWGHYPMSEAHRRIEGDLLLRDYQSWRQRNPDAQGASAAFIPNAKDQRWTWVFEYASSGDQHAVGSRMSYPTPAPLAVYENRDGMLTSNTFTAESKLEPDTPLLGLEKAAGMYASIGGKSRQPTAIVQLRPSWHAWEPNEATVIFGEPDEPYSSGSTLGASMDFVFLEDSVTVDLVDGGLRGVNNGFAFLLVYWSQLPTFAAMDMPMPDELAKPPNSARDVLDLLDRPV